MGFGGPLMVYSNSPLALPHSIIGIGIDSRKSVIIYDQ